jgi:hypothetical protein
MAVFSKKDKSLSDTHIATIISDTCKINGTIKENIDVIQGVIIGDISRVNGKVTMAKNQATSLDPHNETKENQFSKKQ